MTNIVLMSFSVGRRRARVVLSSSSARAFCIVRRNIVWMLQQEQHVCVCRGKKV